MTHTTAFALLLLAPAADPPPVQSQPAPELSALFERTDGWVGGDGAYSVALSPQRSVWLFGDTWVGAIRDGKRSGSTIVNNTAAVMDGRGAGAKMDFAVRRGADGKPAALLTPADGRGWFWPQAGASHGGKLYLFLAQIEKAGGGGVFGFRQVGQWLGIVANPNDPPTDWRVEQKQLPCVEFSPRRSLTFGAAALVDGDHLYVYGVDEDPRAKLGGKKMVVARVPLDAITDFAAWRFFRDGRWDADWKSATPLAGGFASEGSVTPLGPGRYVAVYTQLGLSDRIVARTAPAPWGPWSEPVELYRCPEMARDKKLFCYAAKAHPFLAAGDNELVVSYCVNSFDFWQVVREAGLYWPRFVRVTLPGEAR
jgi:hypothetical protein